MEDAKKMLAMTNCVIAWKRTIDQLLAEGMDISDILTTGQTVMATLAHNIGCPGGNEFGEYAKSIFDQIDAEMERLGKGTVEPSADPDKPPQPMMN